MNTLTEWMVFWHPQCYDKSLVTALIEERDHTIELKWTEQEFPFQTFFTSQLTCEITVRLHWFDKNCHENKSCCSPRAGIDWWTGFNNNVMEICILVVHNVLPWNFKFVALATHHSFTWKDNMHSLAVPCKWLQFRKNAILCIPSVIKCTADIYLPSMGTAQIHVLDTCRQRIHNLGTYQVFLD